ncbi:hypothetical protein P7228_13235 [Altererythrobacter arenosus]|uniref:Ferric oxidoreductase domain-containing protein n=1 Tax=Altererythrobacter arenosus TaxID=3032592 RepID=A0ABY8FPK4_9SPHN|nr:ferric reductase-like transmembrane domain-containing protein [Altererythrobacter sp. CAU 1644]WFL76944.1 hypothetical protein P7228_13235 [Altererythrobacter sp. CAU 1644]
MQRWPMWLGLALGLGALYFGLSGQEGELEQWSAATRYTARVGFPLFMLAYVARPLVDLTRADWARALLAKRKWIGLGFAMSHTVHLVAIVMLFRTLGEAPTAAQLIFGGFAYVMLCAMALTSNRSAMKALGAKWKTLHRFGIHYLWLIYAQSYFKRIPEGGTMEEGLAGSLVVLAAAAIRFAAWRKKRQRQAAATAVA